MIKTSRVEWFRRPKLLLNRKSINRKLISEEASENKIKYPLRTGVCIIVFGNRVWCDRQAMCYREFVRDVVNRLIDFRELN